MLYNIYKVVEMAQDKVEGCLTIQISWYHNNILHTLCTLNILFYFFIVHIRYIILVYGSKHGYNTGCETSYTKQHDKPGARAWILKTVIFIEKKNSHI
jgi:hypothetical protein